MGEAMKSRPYKVTLTTIVLCGGVFCSGAVASNLDQINAAQAWAVTTDCTGGDMVYIVDFGNGVDITHPALAPLPGIIYQNPIDSTFDGVDEDNNGYTDDVWGWDFYHNQEDPYPDGNDPYPWHDTVVTGIMATNGTNGAYGICRTAHVIVLKKDLADYYGDPTVINQIVQGLNYAVNFKREIEGVVGHSVHMVINNSYPVLVGTTDWRQHPDLQAAIDNAAASDIGMFFAATNSSQSNDDPNTAAYPASYNSPNVISVGAVDGSDKLSSISNYGNAVQIAAPSVNIYELTNSGGYAVDVAGTQGFTSFATPHATAAAAMYWAQNPSASFAQVRSALLGSADRIRGLPVLDGNRLNLGQLINPGGAPSPSTQLPAAQLPAAQLPAAQLPSGPSPSGTTIPSASQIVDASGDVWTVSGGEDYVNGIAEGAAYIVTLLYYNGSMYLVDQGGYWYVHDSPGKWTLISGDPRMGGAPASPSGSTIPSASQIVDASGDVWTVWGGYDYVNGAAEGAAFIVTLLYYNGDIYLVDQGGNWYVHDSPGKWTLISGDPRG